MRGGSAADTLQQAMLPVAGHSACSRVNGRLIPVDEKSMVCAGGQGKGGCQVLKGIQIINLKFNIYTNIIARLSQQHKKDIFSPYFI